MKKPINEIKKMQLIAGLITESEYQESLINESFKDRMSSKKQDEGFKDRVAAKKNQKDEPMGDLKVIFDIAKKEAGKDYEVSYNNGAIYILLPIGGYVIGQTLGVRIIQEQNGTVKVGFTNRTVDTSGTINMSGVQKFNPKDINGIMDACADMLQQIEDQN